MTLKRHRFTAGKPSTTLAQKWNTIGSRSRVFWVIIWPECVVKCNHVTYILQSANHTRSFHLVGGHTTQWLISWQRDWVVSSHYCLYIVIYTLQLNVWHVTHTQRSIPDSSYWTWHGLEMLSSHPPLCRAKPKDRVNPYPSQTQDVESMLV